MLTKGAAVLGGTVAAGQLVTAPEAGATVSGTVSPATQNETVTPDDPRYPGLMTGNNQRFVAHPAYVRMARSAEDVRQAVQEAARTGKRLSVRSGGHCFADFVCHPGCEIMVDCSQMKEISYNPRMKAFSVEPGCRLINVYEKLFQNWGVTIPGGICYSVGAGGHIVGGGYGLLSRQHGLVVDHLYAVEVVVVDERGRARTVMATRERDDPNRDLWWAHTGGGGGNFGVVTRYWFRSPRATGDRPSDQLVSPPGEVLVSNIALPWDQLDESTFVRLMSNFGSWHEANSGPASPYAKLSSLFNVNHRAHGSLGMFTQVDGTVDNAEQLLDDYVSAILAGTGITPQPVDKPSGELSAMPQLRTPRRLPWTQATRLVGTNNPIITDPTSRGAHKSAYMRKSFTDRQARAIHRHMSGPDYANPNAMIVMFSFGGRVNAVPEDATANSQRDSTFKLCFQTFWQDEADDAVNLTWARDTYEEVFAETGGVPDVEGQTQGCYINYPDTDVADPAHNRSDIAWHTLYYRGNYPRLQRVKRRWDPLNFFRHSMSIEPA